MHLEVKQKPQKAVATINFDETVIILIQLALFAFFNQSVFIAY
jgi:hypothetical protein